MAVILIPFEITSLILFTLVSFLQSLWSVANNSRSSRADLMSILADIESVRLRASYSTAVADTSISDVLLESALESSVGEIAKEVERCVCPPKASGTSCEVSTALRNRSLSFV